MMMELTGEDEPSFVCLSFYKNGEKMKTLCTSYAFLRSRWVSVLGSGVEILTVFKLYLSSPHPEVVKITDHGLYIYLFFFPDIVFKVIFIILWSALGFETQKRTRDSSMPKAVWWRFHNLSPDWLNVGFFRGQKESTLSHMNNCLWCESDSPFEKYTYLLRWKYQIVLYA